MLTHLMHIFITDQTHQAAQAYRLQPATHRLHVAARPPAQAAEEKIWGLSRTRGSPITHWVESLYPVSSLRPMLLIRGLEVVGTRSADHRTRRNCNDIGCCRSRCHGDLCRCYGDRHASFVTTLQTRTELREVRRLQRVQYIALHRKPD